MPCSAAICIFLKVLLSDEQRSELRQTRADYKNWPECRDWPGIELPDVPQWLLVEAVNNGYVVYNWPE
ncbi:phage tail protein [Citrobacter braakii]|uniref:phage tail protein n=1 Tax=Citrobacter braakii TaxID=57706 RepID=UPI002B253B68|nr:phage tail protein [Citrobacter braakii]MEB2439864.1 phage tail protein [Citrobacter braakii]